MKRSTFLLALPLLLASACASAGQAASTTTSSPSSVDEGFHVAKELVGRWYVTSSGGTIPQGGIFDIFEDDTLDIGEVTLELQGNYAGYEEAYLFSYGTIDFIVSYDAEKDLVDWAYENGDDYDMGVASSKAPSKYAYEGASFPMGQINEYLGTSGSITPMEASSYKLQLFVSYYGEKKCASVEMSKTSLKQAKSYVAALQEEGYSFPDYEGVITNFDFAVGYDESRTYLIRINYFESDEETDLFVFAYDEAYPIFFSEASEE